MKTQSYLLALLILIAPFFSFSNIFQDGTVLLYDPKVENSSLIQCSISRYTGVVGKVTILSASPSSETMGEACKEITAEILLSRSTYNECPEKGGASITWDGLTAKVSYWVNRDLTWAGKCALNPTANRSIGGVLIEQFQTENCPPTSFPSAHANVTISGSLKCFEPIQASQSDSCDFNDVYSNPVVEPNACISKSDGSLCAVSSVSIGGGNSAYMPTENDCYSDVYPILDENGGIGNMPDGSTEECTQSGALSYCPANPDVSCPAGQCDSGCGYMNDQFICISPTDTTPTEPCVGDACTPVPPTEPCVGDACTPAPPTEPCVGDACTPAPCEAGDTSCTLVPVEKGAFDLDGANAALNAIKIEFQNKIDSIKNESSTLIPAINGGAASFNSCFDVVSFRGVKENRCLTEYADEMLIISKVLLFIFTVISAFIVLSGVTKK